MSAKIVDSRVSDETARVAFVNSCLSTTQSYTPHEQAILTQAEQTLSTSKDEEEIIDESPFFPKFVSIKDAIMIGTCTGVVQTSPDAPSIQTKQSVWSTITTTSPTLAEKCLLL